MFIASAAIVTAWTTPAVAAGEIAALAAALATPFAWTAAGPVPTRTAAGRAAAIATVGAVTGFVAVEAVLLGRLLGPRGLEQLVQIKVRFRIDAHDSMPGLSPWKICQPESGACAP